MSLIVAGIICVLFGGAGAQPAAVAPPLSGKNVLIVYLSRTNNTKAIADIIHQEVGGTIVALELERPYPADYRAIVQQVVRENETGYLPPLKTKMTVSTSTMSCSWDSRLGRCGCHRR